MTDRFTEIEVFVRVAERGSLSAAARELRLSQPSVSRLLAGLEERVGARLLLRTTRRTTLTEAGAIYLDRVRPLLAELEEARDAARGAGGLRGVLRIAMPVAFGVRQIVPLLPAFLARHPELRVELRMADQTQDLVAEGVDLALRLGALGGADFVARKLATARRFVVAEPAYVQRVGTPADPAELSTRDCILGPGAVSPDEWIFRTPAAEKISVRVHGRVAVTAADAVVAAACSALGFALASDWLCRAELDSGRLVRVLAGFEAEPATAHAVFPAGRKPPQKARAFADHVAAALGVPADDQAADRGTDARVTIASGPGPDQSMRQADHEGSRP